MLIRALLATLLCIAIHGPGQAQEKVEATIGFLGRAERVDPPISLVEPALDDEGLMGARQAVEDNATTGSFLGHDYAIAETVMGEEDDAAAIFETLLADGLRLFVSDLRIDDLRAITPLADEAGALIFNSRAPDDVLRREECSPSVFHVAPSRAMLADGLAQFLVWKRWTEWAMIEGSHPEDALLAEAYRRAARRYGADLVEERVYEDPGGARRSDTGHVQIQRQMPVETQAIDDHDVLLVADESRVFGDYLPYNTWDAKPVVGSAGLTPTSWSRVHEQWGGTQVQRRFERFAGRWMTPRDFDAWLAVRAIGEAVTRTNSADPAVLSDYLVGDDFTLAAFKGEGLTFRHWNQQMRQPILVVQPKMLVSVSPQEQFLHQRTPLDTLGYDAPESACALNPAD